MLIFFLSIFHMIHLLDGGGIFAEATVQKNHILSSLVSSLEIKKNCTILPVVGTVQIFSGEKNQLLSKLRGVFKMLPVSRK